MYVPLIFSANYNYDEANPPASIDSSFSLERYSSITLPPALNVDSEATVDIGIASMSPAIFDKTLYFRLLFLHHSNTLKEELLVSGI